MGKDRYSVIAKHGMYGATLYDLALIDGETKSILYTEGVFEDYRAAEMEVKRLNAKIKEDKRTNR